MYLKMTTTFSKEVTESQMTAATAQSQKFSAVQVMAATE